MTSAELANILKIKETYLKSHWRDIVKSYSRAGLELWKNGRGAAAEFGIKGWGMENICWSYDDYCETIKGNKK